MTDEEIRQAIERIALTADGEVLYAYLQKMVMFVPDLNAADGALRCDQGRRRFALDLMALMAKGIEQSVGSSGSRNGSERLVVFANRQPASSGRHVNIRDHLRDHDPELLRLTAGDGTR